MRRLLFLAALLTISGAAIAKPLTIGITQYPSTLHPAIDSMLAKSYVLGLSARPFVVFDADWKPVCMVCESLPTLENGGAERIAVSKDVGDGSGEGMAVTFRIKEGTTWADGTPVTVDDVIFAWEVGKHPDTGVHDAESYRRILEVRKLDDRTFTLINDRVTFRYNLVAVVPLPAHIERDVFEADPKTYRNRTKYVTAPTTPGLYFGPYRVSAVQTGASIALEPNAHWTGAEPAFERILIRAVGNTAALEANLRSGAVDYIAGELGLSIDQAIALERRARGRYRFEYRPGLIYEHMDADLDHPVLEDRRVRQALLKGGDIAILRALKGQGAAAGLLIRDHDDSLRAPLAEDVPMVTVRRVVPVDWTDVNGHMNEGRYGQLFSDAAEEVMAYVGADDDYIAGGNSYFTVETTTKYIAETHAGEMVDVWTTITVGEGKKLRCLHEMKRTSDGELMATCDQFMLHVSLETRRTCDPLPHVREKVEALAALHAEE